MNQGFKTMQGVMRATSKTLTGPYKIEWRHLHKEGQYPVEGSSVFPLIGSDEYVLMYDCYAEGYYQFCKSKDLKNFTFVQNTPTSGNFTPRHGSVMQITAEEQERLLAWSDLQTALFHLQERKFENPDSLSLRDNLITKAQHILNGPCQIDNYRQITEELKQFGK